MLTFLVIDDDEDFQELFRIAVKRSGLPIRIVEANDGRQGLNLLADEAFHPELVLLDLNMPRMDGYGFLEAYACIDQKKCPVVMLTGSDEATDRYKTMAYPFVKEFLEKPVSISDVLELSELVDQLSE